MVFQLLLAILCKACFHIVAEGDELLHSQILLPLPETINHTQIYQIIIKITLINRVNVIFDMNTRLY